jgi:starch phosphorylase
MRESMARLTPAFSSNRAVREYTEKYYLPAAASFLARAAEEGKLGIEILNWRRAVADRWVHLRLGDYKVDGHSFYVQAHLDELAPEAVQVELYAEGVNGGEPFRQPMQRKGDGYTATVVSDRPAGDFTARIVPHHAAATVPLEAQQILWYR